MSRSNNTGQNYAKLDNAWNNNEFMKKYEQVNNPYFPFVFGNPDGYATNTNPRPFNWGDPNATKYCACGASLQLQQGIDHNTPASKEGLCSQCASSVPLYKERDAAGDLAQDLDDDMQWKVGSKKRPSTFPLQDDTEQEPDDLTINDWGGVSKQTTQQNLTLLNSFCAANPSSDLCSTEGFGASSMEGYGRHNGMQNQTQSINYDSTQQADVNSLLYGGSKDKFYDQPVRDDGNPLENQAFCQATNGGKKLAF